MTNCHSFYASVLTVLSFEVLFCKMCKSVRLKWGDKYTSLTSFLIFFDRHDKRRGFASSWTWIPNANTSGMSPCALRHNAWVLAQGSPKKANFWNITVETRRFFHHVWFGVQGCHSLLIRKEKLKKICSSSFFDDMTLL